jgi:signal transduction histidine kinase
MRHSSKQTYRPLSARISGLAPRRRSLGTRLAWSHLLATSVGLALLGGTLWVLLTRNQRAQALASLNTRASIYAAYAADLASNTAILEGVADRVVRRFPPQAGTFVRIFAANGSLLSSDQRLGQFPSRAVQPLIASQAPFLPLAPEGRLYVAQPILRDNQRIGVVEVSSDLQAEQRFRREMALALLPASLLALGGAAALALLLARSLLRPLIALRNVAGRIATGDLSARADDHGSDEIAQLARAINQMAADLHVRFDEIRRLAETRREFYRSVSHELRTPLTALRGMAENLEDSATPEQRRSVEIIQAETERLQRLVNELLAGGEREFVALREKRFVDAGALAANVVELMRPRAARGGVTLHYYPTGSGGIGGDADRLKQALVNLLDNALKWTPAGGEVRVTVSDCRLPNEAGIAIAVADTGPGIPNELRAEIGGRGIRGPDGGHGLGLALVREIVEAHGGEVRLHDGPGTTIELCFPRLASAEQAR